MDHNPKRRLPLLSRMLDALADHAAAVQCALAEGSYDEAARIMLDHPVKTLVCRALGVLP